MDFDEWIGLIFWGAVLAGIGVCGLHWLWLTGIPNVVVSSLTIGLLLKTGGSLLFGSTTLVGAGIIAVAAE